MRHVASDDCARPDRCAITNSDALDNSRVRADDDPLADHNIATNAGARHYSPELANDGVVTDGNAIADMNVIAELDTGRQPALPHNHHTQAQADIDTDGTVGVD